MQGVSYVLGVKGLDILNHYTKFKYGGIFHFNVAATEICVCSPAHFLFLQGFVHYFTKKKSGGGCQKQTYF